MSEVFSYGKVLLKKVLLGLKSNKNKHPEKVLYETYRTIAYLSAFKGKYVIVKSIDQRTGASKFFVCNNFSWEAQKILEEYSYRWMIEEFFGNAKGLCGFEGACIRSEQGGALALFLVSFVDLLVSIQLWKGVHDNSKGELLTVSAIFAAATEENLQNLLAQANETNKFQDILETWLQILQLKKRKTRRERKILVPMTTEEVWVQSLKLDDEFHKFDNQLALEYGEPFTSIIISPNLIQIQATFICRYTIRFTFLQLS